MKTPSQTADYLKTKKDDSAVKALKERERYLQRIGKELTDIVNHAIDKGTVTEKGGEIEYPNFNCMDRKEGLKDVKEIFRRAGWNCNYRPQEDSGYSMTTKSETYFTNHYFDLAPLKNAEKARDDDKLINDMDKRVKNKKIRPLSDKERKEVEARIKERLRPYTTKRRPSLDDFTPM